MRIRKFTEGYTFVELIVATTLLGIVVAGVFTAFISSLRLTGFTMHDVQAVVGAQGYLEQARAANRYQAAPGEFGAIEDTIVAPNPSFWPFFNEVENYNLSSAVTTNVSLGTNQYPFKRIHVRVQWNEKEM